MDQIQRAVMHDPLHLHPFGYIHDANGPTKPAQA